MLRQLLSHPLARGVDIDDPRTTALRRDIIQEKAFLRRVYEEWYNWVRNCLPQCGGSVLELGSGAGFLDQTIPDLITSEICFYPWVKTVSDACALPFKNGTLRAIVLVDVLHHVAQARLFFAEAARAVHPGGVLLMIEPWVSRWSSFVYSRLHHEQFDPRTESWEFPARGPLSGANNALPWILFERDRSVFEKEFPEWQIECIEPTMPFRYILSGGVSMRSFAPGWSFGIWRRFEAMLAPLFSGLAMFARIRLRRKEPLS